MKTTNLFTILTAAALFSASCSPEPVGGETALRFGADGTFKILQLSDLHIDIESATTVATAATITAMVETERPQLIVITGDVVSDAPADKGWTWVCDVMGNLGVPWCVTMGNHDGEKHIHGMGEEDIFAFLVGKPGYVGQAGEEMSGTGNFALEVLASDSDSVAALIYCLDSGDYPTDEHLGKYDWIHLDQIEWYYRTSDRYRLSAGGEPVPSLAFFHIPLPEADWLTGMPTTVGTRREHPDREVINSGMLATMLLQGDVMGTFSGHNHDNDFAGMYKGILMSYCRVGGVNAYGELTRGGRSILLHEGERRFDTWLATPEGTEHLYHYPSGISQRDETEMEYLPAIEAVPTGNGVRYKYFEGERIEHTDHLYSDATVVKEGTVKNFTLAPAEASDAFGFEYNTLIKILRNGVYRFFTNSDDGSRLYIDNILVVDNDGSHDARRIEGLVALEAGYHRVRVLWFDDYMGQKLEVGIVGKELPETLIPDNMLFY